MKSMRSKSIRESGSLELEVIGNYNFQLELLERIEELEGKVFKNNRLEVSLAQKILLLKHSGILEPVSKLFKNQKDKISFLSFLLDGDKDMIEKYLRVINIPESIIDIPRNYEKLVTMFKEIGFKEQELSCEKRLDELLKIKESRRKR